MTRLKSIAPLLGVVMITANAASLPQPPVAATHDYVVKAPAGERHDPYYWLRDDSRSKPEVLDYLRAENSYYDAVMAPHKALEDKLFNEMVGRIQQDDATAPQLDRDYWYYTRYEQGKDYPIVARRKGDMNAPEQVMLDGNVLAKDLAYFHLSTWEVSQNQQLLAYTVDNQGRYQNNIRIRDLSTGKDFPETITGASAGIAWSADNKSFFYVENDPVTLLSFRVKRHVVGTEPDKDATVYEEQDKSFYTSVYLTNDHQYIVIDLSSTVSSEQWLIPANAPDSKPVRLAARERDFEYSAGHIGQRWVI